MQENSRIITNRKKRLKNAIIYTRGLRGAIRPKTPDGEKKPRLILPITDRETTNRIKLQAQQMGKQPYMLILIGLNTGLRISDILPLKVGDIRGKEWLVLYEKKTGKRTEIPIHPVVEHDVRIMTAGKGDDELLFASRHGKKQGGPIDYVTAYRWVKKACSLAGVDKYVGCHTLRKTYGYNMYKKYHDVGALMKRFNHSSQTVTLRYIGLSREIDAQRARETLI